MTPLTRVKFNGHSRLLLKPLILIRLGVLLSVAVIPAMGLTYLRFQTRDMQIETSKLQAKRQILASYKSNLVSQVEQLKRYDRMHDYAQARLGLRECPPEQTTRVALSPQVVERWNNVIDKSALREEQTLQSTEHLIAQVGEKVISWSSVSMARDVLDKRK